MLKTETAKEQKGTKNNKMGSEQERATVARDRRIRVFLSSEINSSTSEARKELFQKLENSSLFDPFAFEFEGASSLPVVVSYLVPLSQCQAFVMLVDNERGPSEAVLREYAEAKKQGLHILAFFCKESSDKITDLQKQIKNEKSCKFYTINHYSEFAEMAYRSLFEDIVWVYSWKEQTPKTAFLQTSFALPTMAPLEISLEKNVVSSFDKARDDLRNYVLSEPVKFEDSDISFEKLFRRFLPVILGDQPFEEKTFQKIKSAVIKRHKKALQSLISLRFSALRDYYIGKLDQAIIALKRASKQCEKQKDVPEWFNDDISIDLRNAIACKDQSRNIFTTKNEGQEKLNQSPRTLYFPYLDRLSSSIRGDIINEYQREQRQSPNTIRFSNDEFHFDNIATYFCTALYYGSITHLETTRNYMIEMLDSLNNRGVNQGFFVQELKYLILQNKDEKLESLLRTSPREETFTEKDLKMIAGSIKNLPLEFERNRARLLLIKYFGYFFSDSFFEEEAEWLFDFSRLWIADPNRILDYRKDILDALKYCHERYKGADFGEIAILFVQKIHVYGVDLIQYIDYSQVTESRQNDLQNYLISLIQKGEKNHIDYLLQYPIIFFCRNAKIDKTPLINIVKSVEPSFYAGVFSLETNKQTENSKAQIWSNLRAVKSQNAHPGMRILGDDEFLVVKAIVNNSGIRLSSAEIETMVAIINETLLASHQTSGTKCSGCDLLNYLVTHYPQEPLWVQEKKTLVSWPRSIFSDAGDDPFEKVEQSAIEFSFVLSLLTLGEDDFNRLITATAAFSLANEASKIRALRSLHFFLEEIDIASMNQTALGLLTEFAASSLKEKELDERYYAAHSLACLAKGPFAAAARSALLEGMDENSTIIRLAIVQSISNINDDDLFKEAILAKAKVDKNYLVRKAAQYQMEAQTNAHQKSSH